eukprot:1188590-Amphidinium_carterae.1
MCYLCGVSIPKYAPQEKHHCAAVREEGSSYKVRFAEMFSVSLPFQPCAREGVQQVLHRALQAERGAAAVACARDSIVHDFAVTLQYDEQLQPVSGRVNESELIVLANGWQHVCSAMQGGVQGGDGPWPADLHTRHSVVTHAFASWSVAKPVASR